MNIQTSKTMQPSLYSPDGRSWNLQGSEVNDTDNLNIISVPVRQYNHRNDGYTILACMNMCFPMEVFYQLAVKRPLGASFPATSDKDARIISRLLEYAPISIGQYIKTEQKLLRKCANMRRREFIEKIRVEHEEIMPVKDETPVLVAKEPTLVDVTVRKDRKTVVIEDDDDDCLGGIMGVYCRSYIHAEYNGVASAEKKIA